MSIVLSNPVGDLTGGVRRLDRDVEKVRAGAAVCAAMPAVHAALRPVRSDAVAEGSAS